LEKIENGFIYAKEFKKNRKGNVKKSEASFFYGNKNRNLKDAKSKIKQFYSLYNKKILEKCIDGNNGKFLKDFHSLTKIC